MRAAPKNRVHECGLQRKHTAAHECGLQRKHAAAHERGLQRKHAAAHERGVAMLMAVVAITVLTVVATEFAFNTRVDLEQATHQRDEIRAYYLARSGVGLSRLLLKFQKQLDGMTMNMGSIMQSLGMPGAATGTPAAAAPGAAGATGALGALGAGGIPGMGSINIQLWQLAKVDCHMLQGLIPPEGANGLLPVKPVTPSASSRHKADEFDLANPELAAKTAKVAFGGFDGCFDAKMAPEEPKLNLNKLDMPQFSSQVVVARLLDMLNDKRFAFLYEQEDANHVKSTAQDVVIALHDWMDDDQTQSTLNLTGQGDPFLKGFADEAALYDKYTPRYFPKNARFDSLDELYMVHGWNDKMMAAFRDRLTVYPDINTPPNINTDDPVLLYMAILSVMDPLHPDPRLGDPMFVNELIKRINSAKTFSFLGMSAQDFISLIAATGIPINPAISANVAGNRFVGDKNQTYTITSVGVAGTTEKTLTVVVRMDDNNLGRVLHWKEQ